MVNSTTTRTVLPAAGRSWDECITHLEYLLAGKPSNSEREEFLELLQHFKSLKIYTESLVEAIEYNKKKPLYRKWPQKIEVRNEYGMMFEIDLRVVPPVRSSAQKQVENHRYTCIYFDKELVLAQERGLPDPDDQTKTKPSIVVFNRLSPEVEAQLKAFFQGGN